MSLILKSRSSSERLDEFGYLVATNSLSKQEISRITGVTRQTVYSWFRGDTSPKEGDLDRLVEALCLRVQ